MADLSPLMSSARQDWQTPDDVLELVRQVGQIMYDPCTVRENPVGAEAFTHPDIGNGLEIDWKWISGGGLTFANPPYKGIVQWVRKCLTEAEKGAEIILLANARTDTRWFDLALDHCDAWCAWRGRIRFRGATSGAPFPSAFFYWGRNYLAFHEAFKRRGRVFRTWSKESPCAPSAP